jgi:hypothetical protein
VTVAHGWHRCKGDDFTLTHTSPPQATPKAHTKPTYPPELSPNRPSPSLQTVDPSSPLAARPAGPVPCRCPQSASQTADPQPIPCQ